MNMKVAARKFKKKLTLKTAPGSVVEFEKLLNDLRPRYKDVEVRFRRAGETAAFIYANGQLVHIVDSTGDEEEFNAEVDRFFDYYRNPPLLWSGCRGAMAHELGVRIDKDFNKWFDSYANQLTGK